MSFTPVISLLTGKQLLPLILLFRENEYPYELGKNPSSYSFSHFEWDRPKFRNENGETDVLLKDIQVPRCAKHFSEKTRAEPRVM